MIIEGSRSQDWEVIESGAGGSPSVSPGVSGAGISGVSDAALSETTAGSRVMDKVHSVNMRSD